MRSLAGIGILNGLIDLLMKFQDHILFMWQVIQHILGKNGVLDLGHVVEDGPHEQGDDVVMRCSGDQTEKMNVDDGLSCLALIISKIRDPSSVSSKKRLIESMADSELSSFT